MKLKDATACLLVDGFEALGTRIDIKPTMKTLGRFASNPDLSFSWYDAAAASMKIRELPYGSDGNRIARVKGI